MISAIVMASGFSRRMKKNKLLMEFDGEIVIDRTLKTIKKSKVGEYILIYSSDEVRDIAMANGFDTYHNSKAHLGQSESIKLGVEVASKDAEGYMFFVGDQPLLDEETIDTLIDTFLDNKDSIVIPKFGDKRGNPVIFPASLGIELLSLEGDVGGRDVIRNNKEKLIEIKVANSYAGMDIDTPEAYDELLRIKKSKY
jgi:molybdenum cofactor cytidylyltransferase